MNKRLKSRFFTALLTVLFFGGASNAQSRLGQSQINQESVLSTNMIQAPTSSQDADVYQISPLEAVKGKKEDLSKRDAYSKHFINDDGSNTALIGAGPIHYEKNGQFLDIDHNITRQSDSQFPYANIANLFESYFGESSHTGVKNKTQEGEITEFLNTKMYWEVNGRAVNTTTSSNVAISIDGDKAYYNNLYGNISAEFIMLTGKRKLNYIIPNRQALGNTPANAEYLVFTEDVKLPEGWKSTVTKNGVLIQNPAGREIYLYENPVSTDAANALSREENTVFETVLNGDILTIMTKVKTEWLLSNERQFPVNVDPTVTVYPTAIGNYNTGAIDALGNKTANNDIYVGMRYAYGATSGTRRFFRGWASFDLTNIPNNADISGVKFGLYVGLNSMDANYGEMVNIGPITSGVPNQATGGTLYNMCAEFGSNTWLNLNAGFTGNGVIDLIPAQITVVKNSLSSNIFSLGFAPAGSFDTGYTEQVGIYGSTRPAQTSNGRPYLTITYTAPTNPVLTVSGAHTGASYADGPHTFANNASVTATSGTRAGYAVTGWTGTGSVPATGTTGSATFTITENSSITWQWEQTGTPNNVVFHNYGGAEQLAFNNSRIATNTPVFRMSHSNYDANAYEIEINSSSNFNGASFTQEFTSTYTLNEQTNFTFNNGFIPIDGTTYYVRARVKGEAEIWSSWTTKTQSFTYQASQTTPDWYQTTQAQFLTDHFNGITANPGGGVVPGAGGNRVENGDFSNGETGWSTSKSYNVAVNSVVNANDGCTGCSPNAKNFKMGYPWAVNGVTTGDNIILSQTIDLTNVNEIKFDVGRFRSFGGIGTATNSAVYFKIGGTLTNETGTTLNTFNINSNGSFNDGTITVNTASYTGLQTIKFVFKTLGTWDSNTSAYFYVSNIVAYAPPAGTIISTPIHLESVVDAMAYEGITWDQTLNGGSLTLKVQESADGITFSDLPGFDNISEADDGVQTVDLSGLATPPAHLRLVGALDGAGATLNSWSVGYAGTPDPVYDFTYLNDTEQWTPNYPGDVSNPSDGTSTILVMEGTAVFNSDIIAGDLTVNENANLEVENNLKLEGNIINNGLITFKSSGIQETAQFDVFNGTISGSGSVTTERFIPARRAYRFVSPSVTTTNTIRENWQENGIDAQGLGTHITGAGGETNGFDPTGTNNPSMFVLDETAQAWAAVENTNATTLTAGNPYLMMVRGDRTIDLTSNNAAPTNTVLRATGALVTGDQTFTGTELLENQEFFIGNPYQAAVSIEQLLNGATNINPNHYYLYNAGLAGDNGRGQYVTVDMDLGGVSTPTSEANGYLQPGQAILVKATGGVPSVTFKESYKNVNEDLTATFRSTTPRISMQLYYADAFANVETPTDGISIKFSENGNNGTDTFDAPKMFNFDENLATVNGEGLYSIESRALPENGEVIELFINSYRKSNYVFKAEVVNRPAETAIYLYDTHTNIYTELSDDGAVTYSFEVDAQNDSSKSESRFEIRFEVDLLSVDQSAISSLVLYPNPFDGNNLYISAKGFEGEALDIQVVNMLGQSIYSGTVTISANGETTIPLSESIASGVYSVNIVSKDNQVINKKLIKK